MEEPILNLNDSRLDKIYFNSRDSKVYLIIWLESRHWELTCKILTRASINEIALFIDLLKATCK